MQVTTAHDADAEIDRAAFNAAFYELGLRWHWDSRTYEGVASQACERHRLQGYLQSEQAHLLRAYDAEFLTDAILQAKQRCRPALAARPTHAVSRFNCIAARCDEVGA
jgi:hypothetical protein